YERNDISFFRGTFRVRGDVLEIFPAYEDEQAVRVELFGDTIDKISIVDPLRGKVLKQEKELTIFPGSHFVTSKERLKVAVTEIREELKDRVRFFEKNKRPVEAQRLGQRTLFDLEMIEELGYCNGIENYSRYLTGRDPGEPPPTLLDYFPDDFILFIDESHIGVPQLHSMYRGDRSRKRTLVEFGFRLPSALDNRPLKFEEFDKRINQVVYVSATPAEFEMDRSEGRVVEQIIRPTGLMDPVVEVRPASDQVDDLLAEVRELSDRGEAVLVTTLTKRMAEDLTEYYQNLGVKVRYLHSDIKTLERVELVRDLRRLEFNVLIGINLLREGLDIPEVSLVAILDADKEGFLRSERSLIQTCGRAARNADGRVILYADRVTDSMQRTIDETGRRRIIQAKFNEAHGITPTTIKSSIKNILESVYEQDYPTVELETAETGGEYSFDLDFFVSDPKELRKEIKGLEKKMKEAAKALDFEEAAVLRDQIGMLREKELKWM
ncbi:MAG: excinuclease ABC subunit UvrB, partial [Desulfobulbaceae bacterium]|nr:excinuclease ABC subunit UvrB [Desulfobulbaceae bacterium]